MGKIELAKTNYERAQDSNPNNDDDDEKLEQDFEALIQLSNTYKVPHRRAKEHILQNLTNALDETTKDDHKRSLEFRLGNFHYDAKNHREANRFWDQARKGVSSNQTITEAIFNELVQHHKTKISRGDENAEDHDETSDTDTEEYDETSDTDTEDHDETSDTENEDHDGKSDTENENHDGK
ncbi:unnamed protein product, partial [Rotaria sp. Silwood1]